MKKLSPRELEIIHYTAKGYTAKQIARLIKLGHRTVESYVANIRRKLGAKNIAHTIFIVCKILNLDIRI